MTSLALPPRLLYNRTYILHQEVPAMTSPNRLAAMRYNALKHGILAQAVIPAALEPYESRDDLDALLATLHDEFAPANAIEELLVEQIATAYWRLARLYRAEAGAIARNQSDIDRALELEAHRRRTFSSLGPLDELSQLEHTADSILEALENPRSLRSTLQRLDPASRDIPQDQLRQAAQTLLDKTQTKIENIHKTEQATAAAERSLPPMDDALKYARYEAALQNQLHRALSSLERLQRLRLGDSVPPPQRLDVTVDVSGVSPSPDED